VVLDKAAGSALPTGFNSRKVPSPKKSEACLVAIHLDKCRIVDLVSGKGGDSWATNRCPSILRAGYFASTE